MEHLVLLEHQGHLEFPGRSDDRDGPEAKDHQDNVDLQERKEIRVLVRWEMWDLQELQAFQDLQATAKWDPQALSVSKAFQASQDLPGSRVPREMTADVVLVTA